MLLLLSSHNKKRINLKIIDRVSQHELSYLLEDLKKMDEFEFVINSEIELTFDFKLLI
jgi:hypothetical protein